MNWLLIIIVLLLALCVVNGYRKGFLRMMYSMVSWVIMFALVTWATPYINTFLRDNTSIYQTIAVYCEQQIREKTAKQIEQEAAAVPGEAADETQPAAGQQAEGVEQNNGQPADLTKLGVKLPDSVMNNISEKTADLAGEALDASGIYAKVSAGMADFILNGISFFIAFAVGMIVLHFFSGILGIVSRIPIIRGINKYLGTVAGAIYGFVVVWIAFYVIALCSTSEVGGALISYIYESPFLTYIYENNLIVQKDFAENTLQGKVPRLFIQPILENAVFHGFSERFSSICVLTLHSHLEMLNDVPNAKYLVVSIRDNGCGMSQDKLQQLTETLSEESKGKSIGLKNVVQRMRLIYGDVFQLSIESKENIGTCFTLRFPYWE